MVFLVMLSADILSDFLPKTIWDFVLPSLVGGFVIALVFYQILKYVFHFDLLKDL